MQNLIFLHVHIKTESFFFFLANEISRLFFSDLFNNSVFPDIIVDPNLKWKIVSVQVRGKLRHEAYLKTSHADQSSEQDRHLKTQIQETST